MASTSTSGGNASSTSMPPIASASNFPRKYPASMPSAAPNRRPIIGASNPTVSEVRAPNTRRASMSISVGLGIGRRFANMAARTTTAIQAAAAQNMLLRRRRRRGATAASSAASSATMADPRIEHGVEHVDREIQHHEAHGDEQHDALQDDEVARIDGADQQPADAGQGEDRLDDDRAADQPADVDAGDGHERERGRLERM